MSIENPWDVLRAATREARALDSAIESQANTLADILTGRLRKVHASTLRKLKRELRDFDMTTGRWKRK